MVERLGRRAKRQNRLFLVYVTTGNARQAGRIARKVVGERLAACANILSPVQSIYWWEGKVQKAREAVLILKTSDKQLEALIRRVKDLHSYECPAIVALPIETGFPAYLDWISAETRNG